MRTYIDVNPIDVVREVDVRCDKETGNGARRSFHLAEVAVLHVRDAGLKVGEVQVGCVGQRVHQVAALLSCADARHLSLLLVGEHGRDQLTGGVRLRTGECGQVDDGLRLNHRMFSLFENGHCAGIQTLTLRVFLA